MDNVSTREELINLITNHQSPITNQQSTINNQQSTINNLFLINHSKNIWLR